MYYSEFSNKSDVDGYPTSYWRGYDDFYKGFGIDDNPYEGEDRELWYYGFMDASLENL